MGWDGVSGGGGPITQSSGESTPVCSRQSNANRKTTKGHKKMSEGKVVGLIVAGCGLIALCCGIIHAAVPLVGLGLGALVFSR